MQKDAFILNSPMQKPSATQDSSAPLAHRLLSYLGRLEVSGEVNASRKARGGHSKLQMTLSLVQRSIGATHLGD